MPCKESMSTYMYIQKDCFGSFLHGERMRFEPEKTDCSQVSALHVSLLKMVSALIFTNFRVYMQCLFDEFSDRK